MHDSAWVLPLTETTLERFRWLCGEIHELGGQAKLWSADSAMPGCDSDLFASFQTAVDKEYIAILKSLQQSPADVTNLARRFQQTQQRDYFSSPWARKTRKALLQAKGDRDP